MDPIVLIGIVAGLVGTVAGVVQVVQYLQQRRTAADSGVTSEISGPTRQQPPAADMPIFPLTKLESNLPRREPFVGREKEKAEVLKALASPLSIVSITGIGGMGKSALAREVALSCLLTHLFDATAWVSARDSRPTSESIYDTILTIAGLTFAAKLAEKEKQRVVSDILRQHRFLVVLDSFEEIADAEGITSFLIAVPSPSKVLLTTRREPSVETISVPLIGMSEQEALELIREHAQMIGLRAVAKVDEAKLRKLAAATGYAPLAIKWALGQMRQKGQSLETVLGWLGSAKGEIFRSMFDYSWSLLDEAGRLALMASSVFAAPATYGAYQVTTNMEGSRLENAIGQLGELAFLEASDELLLADRCYSIHPLTRSFAQSQLRAQPVVEHQLHSAAAAYFLDFAIRHGGEKWDWGSFEALEREYTNIISALNWYFEQKDWQAVEHSRDALSLFLSIRGHWSKRIELAERALTACKHTGNREKYAWCLVYDLAYIDLKYNHLDRAEARVKEGLDIFVECRNELGVATSKRHLGRIEHTRGNYDLALSFYQESYDLYVNQDPEYGAFLLCDLGELYFAQQQYESAEASFRQALKQSSGRPGKSETVQAIASGNLGELAEMRGEIDQARSSYIEELSIAQRIGRADEIAMANKRLARLFTLSYRDYSTALRYTQAACLMYYQLADSQSSERLQQDIKRLEHLMGQGTESAVSAQSKPSPNTSEEAKP